MQRSISEQWCQLDIGLACLEWLWNCLFWELVRARLDKELCGSLSQERQTFAWNELHGPGCLFQLVTSLLLTSCEVPYVGCKFCKGFLSNVTVLLSVAHGRKKKPHLPVASAIGSFPIDRAWDEPFHPCNLTCSFGAVARESDLIVSLVMRSGSQCRFPPANIICKIICNVWYTYVRTYVFESKMNCGLLWDTRK